MTEGHGWFLIPVIMVCDKYFFPALTISHRRKRWRRSQRRAAGRRYLPFHIYGDSCAQPTLQAGLQACYEIAQGQPLAMSLSKRGSKVGNEENIFTERKEV